MKKTLTVVFSLAAAVLVAAPPKSTPEVLAKGKASYATNCVLCHGEKGDGNGPAGQAMNPKPRDFNAGQFKNGNTPEGIFKTLGEGLKDTAMVSFQHLSEEERWALAHYVNNTFAARKAPKK
jgi:mono/diheme cytochrome c family protein